MALKSSNLQRCPAMVVCPVLVNACFQQALRNARMALLSSKVQSCSSLVGCLVLVSPGFQQALHNAIVAFARSIM